MNKFKFKKYFYIINFFLIVLIFFLGFIEIRSKKTIYAQPISNEKISQSIDLSAANVLPKVFELNSEGKHKEALDLLILAIKQSPHESFFKTLLSSTFSMFLEEEIKTNQDMINNNKENISSYIKIAEAFELLDNNSQGLEALVRAIAIDDKNTDVWMNIAKLELKSNRPNEAIDVFKEVIKIDKTNADAYNNIAYLLLKNEKANQKDLLKAVEYSKKAYSLNPSQPEYLDTIAEAYYRSGEYKQAKKFIKKAIALSPENYAFKEQLKKIILKDDAE